MKELKVGLTQQELTLILIALKDLRQLQEGLHQKDIDALKTKLTKHVK